MHTAVSDKLSYYRPCGSGIRPAEREQHIGPDGKRHFMLFVVSQTDICSTFDHERVLFSISARARASGSKSTPAGEFLLMPSDLNTSQKSMIRDSPLLNTTETVRPSIRLIFKMRGIFMSFLIVNCMNMRWRMLPVINHNFNSINAINGWHKQCVFKGT